mmetsp:Transcript_35698/g.54107  ORF Transcript_35698/g.54107 Transcript_35698/m.54107 type:complete len:80 (-) Transcript_35698:167-406(-)
MDLRGSSCWRVSTIRVSAIPPEPMWPSAEGAAGAAGAGAAAAGAGAAAAGAGAGAAAASRDFKYSSKEGAAEMDLRGSS